MKIYDDLYKFYVVAKSNSLSTAAKKMQIEQSSVSNALNRLEKRLNHTLLIRKRTGSQLTDDGLNLYQNIAQNFSHINNTILDYVENETSGVFEDLRIITTTGTLSTLIIDVIEKYKADFPQVSINLKTYEGLVNFTDMNVDIAILPTVSDAEAVSKKKVGSLTSHMFCSPRYIEQYGMPDSLSSLKSHKFIGYYNSLRGYKGNVDWHLHYSATGEADIKINHAFAQIHAAKKGLGIVAIPIEVPMPKDMILLFPEKNVKIDIFTFTKRGGKNKNIDIFESYVKQHLINRGDNKNEKSKTSEE